jgi:iron complex outermembrane recepter protein
MTMFKRALLGSATAMFAVTSVPVFAQGIEEIVVTARKRAETLQEVPLAITAFSGEELKARGAQNLYDIAAATPGMIYFENINNTLGTPVIRGLSQTVIASPDRNVAIFYNGVFLSETNAANFDLLDLERVEVVKGPQSALYGRNAFAGAINYVPGKASTESTFGSVEVTAGNYSRAAAKGFVNVPLGDNAAARVAVGYDRFGGTTKNFLDPGKHVGGYATTAASWDLMLKPSEQAQVNFFGFWTDDKRETGATFAIDNNCGQANNADTRRIFFCGAVPTTKTVGVDPRSQGNERKGLIAGVEAVYDFEVATATLSGSIADIDQSLYVDRDFSVTGAGTLMGISRTGPFGPAVRFAPLKTFVGNGAAGTPDNTKDYNAELRFESAQDQAFRWLAGASYYRHNDDNTTTGGVDTSTLAAGESPRTFLAAAARPIVVPGVNVGDQLRTDRAWAGFAAIDIDVTDQLTFGAEARRDRDKRLQLNRLLPVSTNPASLNPQTRVDKYWTFRFNADYKVTDDALVYASVAKGYLSGFFNGTFDNFAAQPIPFDLQNYGPSTNWTYELGAKTTWMDGRVVANAAIFKIDYKDLHITATPPPPLITALTINAATATSKGFELELAAKATEQLTASVNYGYSDPKFGDGVVDLGTARFCGSQVDGTGPTQLIPSLRLCSTNVGGKTLTRTSNHTLSSSLTLEDDITADLSYSLRGDVRYQSKQYTRSNNVQWVAGRTLINVRAALTYQENLEFSLWAKNLFDKKYATVAIAQPFFATDFPIFVPNIGMGDRRTMGATARYKF